MSRRPLSVLSACLTMAACGGGGPGTPTPMVPVYSLAVVVFYDENGNGQLDAGENGRVPGVTVAVGGRSAKTAALTGQATLAAVLGLRRGDMVDADGTEPRLVIPPERLGTKARRGRGRAHIVPLSAWALATVKGRLEAVTTDHLFPQKPTPAPALRDQPMGWNFPMTQTLRYQLGLAWAEQQHVDVPKNDKDEIDESKVRALIPRWTVHNLRHTLATHMREQLRVSRDVVALILGHQQRGGSQATAIYDRAELLPERRAALVAWAAWLEQLRTGEEQRARVLPMAGVDSRFGAPAAPHEDGARDESAETGSK